MHENRVVTKKTRFLPKNQIPDSTNLQKEQSSILIFELHLKYENRIITSFPPIYAHVDVNELWSNLEG